MILSCLLNFVEEDCTIETFSKLALWDNELLELFVERCHKERGDEYCHYYMNEFKKICSENYYKDKKIKFLLLLYVIKFYDIDFPLEIFIKSSFFDIIEKNFSDINSRINFLEEEVKKLKETKIKEKKQVKNDDLTDIEMDIIPDTEFETMEIIDDISDDFEKQLKQTTDNLVDKGQLILEE